MISLTQAFFQIFSPQNPGAKHVVLTSSS